MTRRSFAGLSFALLLVAAAVRTADASPILVGSGVFVSPTLVDFSGIANEQLITTQFAASGVTFSGALYGTTNSGDTALFPSNGGGVIASNWLSGQGLQGLSFTAAFGSLQTQVGFFLENWPSELATIELFNGSTSLGSVNYTTASPAAEFVGIQDLSGFDRMVFTNTATSNGFYAVDDFRFEQTNPVPEPSTWLLLGTGLATVVARRRFTKRA